jgi:hypothetical protein
VRKKKRKGERERPTSGAQASARAKKKKKRERAWAGAGKGWRAAGPFEPKGEKVRFLLFFLFQTPFKTTFLFEFKSNSFKLFLKNFINFLETTQASKN